KVQDYQTNSFGFGFLRVPQDDIKLDFSSLFNLEFNEPVYRITNLNHCAQSTSPDVRLCLEFNLDFSRSRGIQDFEELLLEWITKSGTAKTDRARLLVKEYKNVSV